MTQKDFEFIADVLRGGLKDTAPDARMYVHDLIERFADSLASTNPRFRRELFFARSGYYGEA